MVRKFFSIIFAVFLMSAAVVCVNAQFSDAADSGRNSAGKEDLPKNVKETLAKGRIDREKKDYEELVQRGEEAAKIGDELSKSFAKQNKLSSEDQKKLDRLEKLAKKIRNELGGDGDDDSDESRPSSTSAAIKMLQETATSLVGMIKENTRYSVSVTAIETSNALLKVVRLLRFGGK